MTEPGNQFANWCLKLAITLPMLMVYACPIVAQSTDVARSINTEEGNPAS